MTGLVGMDETGNVGQERVITRTGQEFVQGPTAPAQATGRFYNEVRGVMDTMPTPAPAALNTVTPPQGDVEVRTGSRNVAGMGTGTGGGFASTVVPEAQTISREEALAQAKSQFLTTFGDDPDWQAKLAEYQGDIDAAYEAILGEEGPLAEGRRLAEETFRRQTEEARTGFRQSRQQLAEQSFLGERQLQQQLAARGLGGAGLAQLGGVQQQIAQGRAATGLYSEFSRSLENIASAEAKSAQQFAEAESNLKLALGQQKLALKQQIDQQQRAYDQFKGQTINALQGAIQSNDYQSYQLAMQDYSLTKQLEAETRQARLDGLSYTTQIINQTFTALLQQAEAIKDDKERTEMINKLQLDLATELDRAGQDLSRYDEGLSPGSIVSDITGRYDFATQPTGTLPPGGPGQEQTFEPGTSPQVSRFYEGLGEQIGNIFRNPNLGTTRLP